MSQTSSKTRNFLSDMDWDINTYTDLMRVSSLSGIGASEALDHLAGLIDLSHELGEAPGLDRALSLGEELRLREDLKSDEAALLHYFLANAWSDLQCLRRKGQPSSWDWEQEETEKAIFHLRSALRAEGFTPLHKIRQCQVLTNLGNVFNQIGRCVEAIEYWNGALAIDPDFGMARGNRGYGIIHYASLFEHLCRQVPFLKHAYTDLKAALALELEGGAGDEFRGALTWIESRVPSGRLEEPEEESRDTLLGATKGEIRYRTWCLENRLFLNPLNDLGAGTAAAKDILATPAIVVPIDDGTLHFGFFNQIKQEFVSARYLYYEGISADRPHYSDRQVILYNTFDYPSYSLAVEKVKAAFRILYSVFDKIAFFLNNYMQLSIPERRVNFRSFWYSSQDKGKGLRDDLRRRENWPLRGLFWLSKDLYEDKPGFRDAIEPDAQELATVRNHLEHKYLKLHEFGPPRLDEDEEEGFAPLADTLAYSLDRTEFEAKTLKLMKIVRAALIYLSLAVYTEEKMRARERGDAHVLPSIPVDVWDDEFKI